jgi:hypothetical protein
MSANVEARAKFVNGEPKVELVINGQSLMAFDPIDGLRIGFMIQGASFELLDTLARMAAETAKESMSESVSEPKPTGIPSQHQRKRNLRQ